jgi:hypothetical protein
MWAGIAGLDSRQGYRIFLFATAVFRQGLWPTKPPTKRVPVALSAEGGGGEVKRPGYESDHSPQSSAEAKNTWSFTSSPPYVFMGWCLIKHRIRLHGVVLI